jgi:hypothetical protein
MSFTEIQKYNAKKEQEAHDARMSRVVPVAKKLIKLIASKIDDVTLGDIDSSDDSQIKLTQDCLRMFLEESRTSGFKVSDRHLVWQLALQSLSIPQELANNSLDRGTNEAMTAMIGKPYEDLELVELDEFFKRAQDIKNLIINETNMDEATPEVVEPVVEPIVEPTPEVAPEEVPATDVPTEA